MNFGITVLPDPPYSRFVELLQAAEAAGFEYGWTYDSHLLWQEPYPFLTAAALATERMRLGLCVTNPGTREPTVTASATATLHDISGGRMVIGIGRGDSARRTIGYQPVKVAEFERSLAMIRDLMNGRPVEWNGKDLELAWARGRTEIPLYVAGYGPRTLAVAGRHGTGVIIQLADPDIITWTMDQARAAAAEAGRDPSELEAVVCAPAVVSDDMASAREQVRWFPAMVSNHVMDLLHRYPRDLLPESLTGYLDRRTFYDYSEHSRQGARHGEFVDDETCDRFCILGSPADHVAKLRELEAIGVTQWNIYLMTSEPERTLEVYGREVIPHFRGTPAIAAS
jgi:probable F420-dependent oxidoreductase